MQPIDAFLSLLPADEQHRLLEVRGQLKRDLLALDLGKAGWSDYQLAYFRKHHLNRIDFSLDYSAALIIQVFHATGRPLRELCLIDYGAGMGTTYLLAARLGCSVIYSDIVEASCRDARSLCELAGVQLTMYVSGETSDLVRKIEESRMDLHGLISRNVIEHIEDLSVFYHLLSRHTGSGFAMVHGTSANPYNPAMALWHVYLHRKYEPVFRRQREDVIASIAPQLSRKEVLHLAANTREYSRAKLSHVVDTYVQTGKLNVVHEYWFNTCDPVTGSWNERLLRKSQYDTKARPEGFSTSVFPGFWGTAGSGFKSFVGRLLNPLIRWMGKGGIVFAPFMFVINRKIKDSASGRG